MWLLDTNICVFLIRRKSARLLERLRSVDVASVGISSITLAELEFGVARSSDPDRNRAALATMLAPMSVEPFSDAAATAYGSIRAELERQGKPLGSLDMLIAAHALALGRVLVTNNRREFERVRGLKVEDWV